MTDDYRDWLKSFEHADRYEAADAALSDLGSLSKRARSLLYPILVQAILEQRAARSRSVKRTIDLDQVFSGESTVEQRKRLTTEGFYPEPNRWVSLDEATAEDHQLYIERLRVHLRGLNTTIAFHEDCLRRIREHGVACLGEIGEAA